MTRVLTYVDQQTGSTGWLVYDRLDCRLAAGGCRMQRGLTAETLADLAARMTMKQRALGLNVDGAKCGLDLDPRADNAVQILARFMDFLRHDLTTRYSMGSDMGTRFDQLERTAHSVGLGSVKSAVQVAQDLTHNEFARRLGLLDAPVGRHTISQRRAGHALAHAALTAAREVGLSTKGLHVGLEGFGNLGRAAAHSFVEGGALVTAVADEYGCVVDPHGLDIARMLQAEPACPIVDMLGQPLRLPNTVLCELPVDVLVLAAREDAMTVEQAQVLPIPVVVVGANCGLRSEVEEVLNRRGVVVVPDFIGGCGGSASMEAVFGPVRAPSPERVMNLIKTLVTELVTDVLAGARTRGVPPLQVARDMVMAAPVFPDRRPYGGSPYLPTGPQPRANRVKEARPNTTHGGNVR